MRILLVDDDVSILKIADLSLTHLGGHDVVCASDGKQALYRAATEKPDLVILDGMMAVMDGFEVCKKLKAAPETRDIPVIFLSGIEPSEEKHALAAGALGVIYKPIQHDLLPYQVESILKRRKSR